MGRGCVDSKDACKHLLEGIMAKRKGNIRDAIAEAVEKEIKRNENQTTITEDERSLDEELNFDEHDFGIITEEDDD